MAAPGSLTARYEAVAGDEDARRELYVARVDLGFTVDEWRALPWWQRKLYLEQHARVIQAQQDAQGDAGGGGGSPLDAAMAGFM